MGTSKKIATSVFLLSYGEDFYKLTGDRALDSKGNQKYTARIAPPVCYEVLLELHPYSKKHTPHKVEFTVPTKTLLCQ